MRRAGLQWLPHLHAHLCPDSLPGDHEWVAVNGAVRGRKPKRPSRTPRRGESTSIRWVNAGLAKRKRAGKETAIIVPAGQSHFSGPPPHTFGPAIRDSKTRGPDRRFRRSRPLLVAGTGFEPVTSGLGANVFHWSSTHVVFRVISRKTGGYGRLQLWLVGVVFRRFRWVNAGRRHLVLLRHTIICRRFRSATALPYKSHRRSARQAHPEFGGLP